MLKTLLAILVACCMSGFFIDVQNHSGKTSEKSSDHNEQAEELRLTTSIIEQEYCRGDADLDVLQVKLCMQYTNMSQQPVVLYKGSDISRVKVSRNTEDAAAQRFEVNASITNYYGENNTTVAAKPGSDFVILPPGGSYNRISSLSVFVLRDGTDELPGAIAAGEHVLQVESSTWNESLNLAKELQQRWRQYGRLKYEPIVSIPVTIKVKEDRSVVDCP